MTGEREVGGPGATLDIILLTAAAPCCCLVTETNATPYLHPPGEPQVPCQSSRWSLVPPGGSQGVVAAATVLASLIAQACFYSPIYGDIDDATRNINSDTTQSL